MKANRLMSKCRFDCSRTTRITSFSIRSDALEDPNQSKPSSEGPRPANDGRSHRRTHLWNLSSGGMLFGIHAIVGQKTRWQFDVIAVPSCDGFQPFDGLAQLLFV